MTRAPLARPGVELEVFGTAVGCALVAGGLSLLAPFLAALTATLAALALAGWSAELRRRGVGRTELWRPGRRVAVGGLAAGAVAYVAPVAAIVPFRALLLAAALVPLWLAERGRPSRPSTPAPVR